MDQDHPLKLLDIFLINQKKMRKTSRWRKLSKIVRWTPFIQTYRKRKYPWVQLAGHAGSFIKGSQGTVLKKCGDQEEQCYRLLMEDDLKVVVPKYHRSVMKDGRAYLELDCCLSEFNSPCIMDIKMGVRTFIAAEIENSKPRADLYEKMIGEDPAAPTLKEHQTRAITKYRYLDWRDCISSTRNLGFRIEGTTIQGSSTKDFKSIKSHEQVGEIFRQFSDNKLILIQYLDRLQTIRELARSSSFFNQHELIGSSLLFVHDRNRASIWMIDFEKSSPVADARSDTSAQILHNVPWVEGGREDGYLIGLESIIQIFKNLLDTL